jgi:hypothetical protein
MFFFFKIEVLISYLQFVLVLMKFLFFINSVILNKKFKIIKINISKKFNNKKNQVFITSMWLYEKIKE